MGNRTSFKCLDCETTLEPAGKWEQCKCGHLYVNDTPNALLWGALDEERVETTPADGAKKATAKRPTKSKDQWTGSETGF